MRLKRIFDVMVSSTGILVASPILLLIAIAVKLESRGPVYYRCTRVGRHGSLFGMLKFRTMLDSADRIDCKLCCNSDVRVTPIGKLLRRTKLNELPQLFNVFLGDMSLVGPRPEDPKFVSHYSDKWDLVLQVKPGIVGPNQVHHRNEEDLFPAGQDPESFYVTHILPEKLERDIKYVNEWTLWRDFVLLLRGVHATLFKGRMLKKSVVRAEACLELLGDVLLSIGAYLLANYVRFETITFSGNLYISLGLIALINTFLFLAARLYARNARFFSLPDLVHLVRIVLLAAILFLVAFTIAGLSICHSRAVFFLYPSILLVFMASARLGRRLSFEWLDRRKDPRQAHVNTFVYGAGRKGVETAKLLQFDPEINLVGFVDDNQCQKDRFVMGLRVVGTGKDLEYLKELYLVQCVVIAIQPQSSVDMEIAQRNCAVARIPEIRVVASYGSAPKRPTCRNGLRKYRFSDRLGMSDVPLMTEVGEYVEDAVAGIIGADHLGEHLCRELGRLGVRKIVLVDSSRDRLRLADRLQACKQNIPELVTWYQPWGFHEETRKIFEKHNVRWIFCNHLSQKSPRASLNDTEPFLDLIDTIRYYCMAQRFPCHGFTLISPSRADCFSEEERSYHHLCEHYISFGSRDLPNGFRSGIVQIPNLLEDDGGICSGSLGQTGEEPLSPAADVPMRFSSSRYSARTILNSLSIQHSGETYVQFPAHVMSLRTLIKLSRRNALEDFEDHERVGNLRPPIRDELGGPELGDPSESASTSVHDLRIVTKPGLPDFRRCEVGFDSYCRYLTTEDLTALQTYMTAVREEHSHNPECPSGNSSMMAGSVRGA